MTDASVCPTGAAGCGFWIVSDRGGVPGGYPFKDSIKDSYEGELKAVINAVHYGIKYNHILDGDQLLVQLDNKGVVALLNSDSTPREDIRKCFNEFKIFLRTNNIKLTAKHVKGHTNTRDQRSKANALCDLRAKEAMNTARKRNNAQTHSSS